MDKPIIFIGGDHGGYEHKQVLLEWLRGQGYQVEDMGAHELNPKDDYPKYAFAVAQAVVKAESETNKPVFGIITCRSAGGVTIAANKVTGARAVAVTDVKSAIHAREHNQANIITLSGDWVSESQAKELVKIFLETEFSHEPRHMRRIAQISEFEKRA